MKLRLVLVASVIPLVACVTIQLKAVRVYPKANETSTIISTSVTPSSKSCLLKCSGNLKCFGVDFSPESQTCALFGASTAWDSRAIDNSTLFGSTNKRYIFQQAAGTCGLPDITTTQFSFATWAATALRERSKFGESFTYGCVKGAAFLSSDLIAKNWSAGPLPTDAERFQNISVTCMPSGEWLPKMVALPLCADFKECRKTSRGVDYAGRLFTKSSSGKTCLPWASQTLDPEPKLKDNSYFKGETVSQATNYCRNPLGLQRPFCIVNNATGPREFCDVPLCEDPRPFECKTTTKGTDYIGSSYSVTKGGINCQPWDATSPQLPAYGTYYRDVMIDDTTSHNKCRNLDSFDNIWCYANSTAVRWDYCQVPNCPGYP